jgi:hypothetical protein
MALVQVGDGSAPPTRADPARRTALPRGLVLVVTPDDALREAS